MKTIFVSTFITVSMAFSGIAMAQSQSANNTSQSGSAASVYNNSHNPKQAPGAIAPGLTASGATCLGSTSFGGSFSGFGLVFGTTTAERYCNAREDAKYIQGLTGNNHAAKERLCDTPEIAAAFARAGQPCANRGRVINTASAASTTRSAAAPTNRVVRSFKNMKECQRYVRSNPGSGLQCRAR